MSFITNSRYSLEDGPTISSRIVRSQSSDHGWCELEFGAGDYPVGDPPSHSAQRLVSLVHISDLHLCDAQSPARLEYLDRFGDPHRRQDQETFVGTFRAQEMLTTQTLHAMVKAINTLQSSRDVAPLDAVVITGDVTDNAQANELRWYFQTLDGGEVVPNSGDGHRWEGVNTVDASHYDTAYWNPEGTPSGCLDDAPRSLYGFPQLRGLTEAAMQPFVSSGLDVPWFSTHGNHDALLQGTVAPSPDLVQRAVGDVRYVADDHQIDLNEVLANFAENGPAAYPAINSHRAVTVTSDAGRIPLQGVDWIDQHLQCGHDHGLSPESLGRQQKYWVRNFGRVRLISLDTVNPYGGWEGSLDADQFDWFAQQLRASQGMVVVVLSHHPCEALTNLFAGDSDEQRIGGESVRREVGRYQCVVAWLSGHRHRHRIRRNVDAETGNSCWMIETASLVDWPQQGRLVDIYEEVEEIVIVVKTFDHAGNIVTTPINQTWLPDDDLAGLSRLLSANDWQRRDGPYAVTQLEGEPRDRAAYLRCPV